MMTVRHVPSQLAADSLEHFKRFGQRKPQSRWHCDSVRWLARPKTTHQFCFQSALNFNLSFGNTIFKYTREQEWGAVADISQIVFKQLTSCHLS